MAIVFVLMVSCMVGCVGCEAPPATAPTENVDSTGVTVTDDAGNTSTSTVTEIVE